ncbi:MAG TPA: hypothetical protein VJ961_05150 [Mariprofundaceae bacterium]|nr:hypothetical protein [Mariprofundaceae bacterium]
MTTSWHRRLLQGLVLPRQIMVVDPLSGQRVRRFQVRWITLLAVMIALLSGAALLGYRLTVPHTTNDALLPQYLQLQRAHKKVQNRLAETEAALELKNKQFDALEKTLDDQRGRLEQLKQRITMYDSILDARRAGKTRILQAKAAWQDKNVLTYDIVLVKGGNYPRYVHGKLRLYVSDGAGHKQLLHLGHKAPELPYKMETHTFLHGSIQWKEDWRPDHMQIIRIDRHGSEGDQTEIAIQGGMA